MYKRTILVALALVAVVVIAGGVYRMADSNDVPRMTQEELQAELGNPDFIIVDVRIEKDWKASSAKIKGAVYEDPKYMQTWVHNYPKDKTIVFYCA